jgi:hypothetical protein
VLVYGRPGVAATTPADSNAAVTNLVTRAAYFRAVKKHPPLI